MKNFSFFILAAVMSLSACGGGGGGSTGTSSPQANFTFVPPTVGQSMTYAESETDTANDKANFSETVTVAQMNSDGTYIENWTPSTGSFKLGSDTYFLDAERNTYDNEGQETLIMYEDINNLTALQSCNHTHANGGRPASVAKGQSWVDSVAVTCNNSVNNDNYSGNSTFLGTESITVPAGTFNAYKIQNIEVDTLRQSSGGTTTTTTTTITTTTWFDTSSTGSRLLKSTIVYTYGGFTPTANTLTSFDMELASYK